jgi:hypothetical protein
VKNEVQRGVKEESNIPCTIKIRKASFIGHTLLRNDLIKQVIRGKREGMGRRGRRYKQLLNDVTEERKK